MVTTHHLGFPRIGTQRQLKFALEAYWRGELDQQALEQKARQIRQENLQLQAPLDRWTVGDFSLYDQVLDTSFLLGNIPPRFQQKNEGTILDSYFQVARGTANQETSALAAAEMTKWFDTNCHYIVPEFHHSTTFRLAADTLLSQITETGYHRTGHLSMVRKEQGWKQQTGSIGALTADLCKPVNSTCRGWHRVGPDR
jgi:5-methyltetrahydropteroyltriglutamate--homocysteine methyltransferase